MTPTRYSNLDYRSVVIVTGTLSPFDGGVPLAKLQDADLVVAVKGNAHVVVKDRYGARDTCIEASQVADIRENLPNVEIIAASGRFGLFDRTG